MTIIIVCFCLIHVTAFQHSVQSPCKLAFTCNHGQKSNLLTIFSHCHTVVVVIETLWGTKKFSWVIHFDILHACCLELVSVSTVLVNCRIKILAAMKFMLELRTSSIRLETKKRSGFYKVMFTGHIDNYLEIHTVYDNWHQHLYQKNRIYHFD